MKRLARTCYRRRRLVLPAWVVLLIGLVVLNSTAGGKFLDDFKLPGSESQEATDLLEEHGFEARTGFSGQVVFQADDVHDPAVEQGIEDLVADVEDAVAPGEVISPYSPEGERNVDPDGTIAYAEVNLGDRDSDQYIAARDRVVRLVDRTDIPGTTIELGGDAFLTEAEFSSEALGFLAAMIILLVAFGSLLAMGLPLLTAIFGIVTGIALVGLVVNVVDMPSFSNQAVAMIGIGVGIDYALFIVTRYREGLHDGLDPEGATVRALDTAGRAVLFAGCTVIIAVLGLFVIGLDMIRGLAIGVSLGVLTTMIASVTLLPAMFGFVGRNIDRLGLPHRRRGEGTDRRSVWARWSRVIQRRPWPALVLAAALLVVLSLPVFGIRLGFGDPGNRPTSDTNRRAYDLVAEGFGPGANGPLVLVAEAGDGGTVDMAMLGRLAARATDTPGVASVSPPVPNEDGDGAIVIVQPETSPQSKETEQLVHTLRDDVVPAAVGGTGTVVKVGGATAAAADFAEFTADRLPWFIGIVLVLSFLLLMVVFRSVLVPLKAVIMNLLSVGAAYGVLVAVFQWGWGRDLVGIGKDGPIEAWVPMMLFAVIFGLSMDYEVFLLSRIREEYDASGDNASAVADGLAATARVITAAAAIMFCVFAAFVLGSDRSLKMFGLGLAVAVLLDATIVRLVLVPATMELLGDRNWWLPRWLDRVLPVVHVEPVPEPVGVNGGTGSEPAAVQEHART
ncbi:MAG TPA: MMPL family transporter [Acidimicrobiales bacterium]|nr:MMPL family transporter [Acidimicrobiales bacterium]